MIFSSVSEIVSISAIFPFISVLINPNDLFENENLSFIYSKLDISNSNELIFPVTVFFITVVLISGFFRFAYLYFSTKVAYSTGADFTTKVFHISLSQPYDFHVKRNSSEIINVVISKINSTIQSSLIPFLTLISSSILILFALIFLIYFDPKITIATISGFSIIYLIIILSTKKTLEVNSLRIAKEHNRVVKLLQEGLGGIRDILLNGTQDIYSKNYKKSDSPLRNSQALNLIIGNSPRFIVESVGIVLISIFAYFLSESKGNLIDFVPVLGVFVLSAQKLLPEIQKLYNSWTAIKSSSASVIDALEFLNTKIPNYLSNYDNKYDIKFKSFIELVNISFSYDKDGKKVLKEINLKINKGSRVGLIGSTGGGKSTLVDLIMGLLEPNDGHLNVDNIKINKQNLLNWQKNISHVPQNIFLTDGTIIENIAFGVEKDKVDLDLVYECARKAQIFKTINEFPLKFETKVGERGVRLSGGQRQRIGIARALYKQTNILIFDEATNSLDIETENDVINSVYRLDQDMTIIMVAHRLETLKECDKIFRIDKGKISKELSYLDII